jgi:hypothetical protein
VYIKVWADGWDGEFSNASGVGKSAGECEFSLGESPDWEVVRRFYVAVAGSDSPDAPLLSAVVEVELEGDFRGEIRTCEIFEGVNRGEQGAKPYFEANW